MGQLFITFTVILLPFSELLDMEPDTKTDFQNFITMALRRKMSWNTLKILLIDVASSLDETKEVIGILLKELEILQSTLEKKERELEKYQNNGFTVETQKNDFEDQSFISETKTDNFQENEQQK